MLLTFTMMKIMSSLFLPSTDARKHKLDEPNCKFEEYIVKVLHTSSAVLSYKVESYCLVLVCILRPEIQRNENTVWIVLKNHQVALRNFLVVNHVYKLMVPQTDKSNYFLDRIPLKVIFQNFSKRFKDTLHHDDLIKSRNMVLLPMNIKLWIMSKNSVPNSNLRRNNSITDSVKRLKRRFVSVSGIITDMWYEESWKNHKCPYCFEETNENYSYNRSDNGDIVNDCKDETDTIPFDGILIPDVNSVKNLQNKACAFGIRSGKVSVRISLHDRYTNNMISVYLNEWKHQLYPFGLLRNATVCFTNMCAKTSKKNNIYYISTPLTQLTHLDLKATERTNLVTCNGGIKFGFSNFELIPDSMVWVPLDTDVVTKLYISKRCKRCKSVALNYKCSNVACPEFVVSNQDNYETYAFANILVKGVNKSDDFLVTLYDDEARRYFEMPDNIWIGLAALSFKSEFIYSVKKQEGHQLEESRFDFCHEQLNECFQQFCDSFMPSKRYHAVCKPMSNIKNAYICVELHEIDAARLSVTHRICCDGN